jgi:hypothetical protein
MANNGNTRALMIGGVIVAAVLIAIRIVLEQAGAPESLNKVFGVVWLYFILPVLFARRIAAIGERHPFRILIKKVFLFGIYTRLMVMTTYMIAYFMEWKAPRFSIAEGGNVGGTFSPVQGVLIIPARNALFWIVAVVAIGAIIGGITLWWSRRSSLSAKPA